MQNGKSNVLFRCHSFILGYSADTQLPHLDIGAVLVWLPREKMISAVFSSVNSNPVQGLQVLFGRVTGELQERRAIFEADAWYYVESRLHFESGRPLFHISLVYSRCVESFRFFI